MWTKEDYEEKTKELDSDLLELKKLLTREKGSKKYRNNKNTHLMPKKKKRK